jgi:hypothetical protein
MKDLLQIFKSAALMLFIFLYTEKSYADPIGNNCWYLNSPLQAQSNSDLVCKVQVLSLRREEAVSNRTKSNITSWFSNVNRMTAVTKVLSIIKGNCPNTIEIAYEYPIDPNSNQTFSISQNYTGLSEKEICIVFLKHQDNKYTLNRINSKLRVVPEVIDYNLGDTPNLRLIAEFLAGCDSNDEFITLQAVEEIGFQGEEMIKKDLMKSLGDNKQFEKITFALGKVKEALRKTRKSKDLVIKSISNIASFQADDSPGIEEPLKLLRMSPSEFDPNDSLKKYCIREFCVSNLQLRLLETMDSTTRRAVIDFNDRTIIRRENGIPEIYRGLRDFDYSEFYKQALDCETVKSNQQMRIAIANVLWIRFERRSVPVIIRLLDDTEAQIRNTAVSALRKCINADYSNSWEPEDFYRAFKGNEFYFSTQKPEKSVEERLKDYHNHEQEYIKYWKEWWQKNKKSFE